jgi:hypothetical protein
MLSIKMIDKNDSTKKEKPIMNLNNSIMNGLVQLSPNQSLKGNIIDRIREMHKNADLSKNCSNC